MSKPRGKGGKTDQHQEVGTMKNRSSEGSKHSPSPPPSAAAAAASTSSSPSALHIPLVSFLTSGLSSVLPWKQLEQLRRLPRLAKVGVVVAIFAIVLSVLTNPESRDTRSEYGSWFCATAGWVSANPPFCRQERASVDWRPASERVWRQFGTERCNIERVSVLDLSPDRFEAEFRFKKSVLVTFPNGAADWTSPADWSKRGLSESYSEWGIHSGQSLEIVRKGGNAKHFSTFADYVDNLLMVERADNDTSEPKHYACDREFFWYSRLGSGLRLPPYFQINRTSEESIFFLGPSLSGVVFHKHSDTWNGVVHGHKRWFLYPNTASPPGGIYHGYSLMNWVQQVYPTLAEHEKPIECVQYPGEILYLAEGTYHATLNLGDTVAVAIQKKKATIPAERLSYEATQLINFLQSQESPDPQNSFNKRLLEIYTQWHKLLPDASEPVLKLGAVLADTGDHSGALPWFRKAIEMDRFFIVAYLNMGKALTELREYAEAEKNFLTAIQLSPELWDNYREYGEFLLKMGRHQDALAVFKKGTELMPDLIPFWFYYKLCQVHVGDLEGAEETERIIQEIKAREEE